MKLFYKIEDELDREYFQYLDTTHTGNVRFLSDESKKEYRISIDYVFHNVDYDTFKKIKQCFQELAQEDEEDREDLKDIKIAEDRLVDNNCKGRFFTLEEVKANLGLDTANKEHEDIRLTRQRADTANNQNNQIKQTYKDILKPLDPEVIKNLESLPRLTKTDINNFYLRDLEISLDFCKKTPEGSKENYIKLLERKIYLMEKNTKNNIINRLQSNPWDPRKPEYNEKGELTSVTIEFKEDEPDDKEKED